jgi:hypothetical protein
MFKIFDPKTIRGNLTLVLTATLAPCLALGFFVTQEFVRFRVYRITEEQLQVESLLISYGLREWGIGVANLAESLAVSKSFINANTAEISSTFKALYSANPNRLWRYWSASSQPKLLAHDGSVSIKAIRDAEINQPRRNYFQAALRGFSTYEVVASKTSGQTCLMVSNPVFRTAPGRFPTFVDASSLNQDQSAIMNIPIRNDVKGVVAMCMPLANLGRETGLLRLFNDDRITYEKNKDQKFLSNPKGFGTAVLLVSNTGQILFPDTENSASIVPTIQDLSKSTIPSLYPLAQRAMNGEELFTRLKGSGHSYLALTSRIDSAWSLILLVNERQAAMHVDSIGQIQVLVALLTISALFVIIAIRSGSVSRPISAVGHALKKIRNGDFDIALPSSSCQEMAEFLSNAEVTATRLKCYLKEVTSFAVTEKEIKTAKAIQQDFLLSSLPSSPTYDASAFSRPALEVGADWYDMVDSENYAFIVLADVCDKGIPSALYMSVFRSLIRSKILDRVDSINSAADASSVISDAIEQTNNYMATNQNSSMMFATLFIAAVNKTSGMMYFICAGHESPVLVSQAGEHLLDTVSGPAIGLFPGVSYTVFDVQLHTGDTLIIYSDGLIDARSPENIGWGIGRLRALLTTTRVVSSSQVLNTIVEHADNHMSDADQFDDLTVMAFRWLGTLT